MFGGENNHVRATGQESKSSPFVLISVKFVLMKAVYNIYLGIAIVDDF